MIHTLEGLNFLLVDYVISVLLWMVYKSLIIDSQCPIRGH